MFKYVSMYLAHSCLPSKTLFNQLHTKVLSLKKRTYLSKIMNMKLITKHLSRDNVCSLAFIFLTLSIRGRTKKYAKLCFDLDTPWTVIKYSKDQNWKF